MARARGLDKGREAFERCAWEEAYRLLSEADQDTPLAPPELVDLAKASFLTGRDDESIGAWERAHQCYLGQGDVRAAVRCAFWLVFVLLPRGDMARAGGWLSRGQRLLEDDEPHCAERGYLLFPVALRNMMSGDPETAHRIFGQMVEIGEHCGDADVLTMGRHGQGRALLRMGRTDEGLALLDESMVAVTAGDVSPMFAGRIYCSVIEACNEISDVRRAHEWTLALSDWCAAQPDLVPYRGQCLVHRSQLFGLRGDWATALDEVRRACERLSDPAGQPALGMALYQLGELHRLRGDIAEAEAAYREADQLGHVPHPGLALLRLAEGNRVAAASAIRHAVNEASGPARRSQLLSAFVEIMLDAGDVASARSGADELAGLARELGTPLMHATSAHVSGLVLLAEGRTDDALAALRRARAGWEELEAPHETGRVRVDIGLAYRRLGDNDGAELEWDAARRVFEELGSRPDLAHLNAVSATRVDVAPRGLTGREIEVLALVAGGKTNREIAADLVLSEHTVRRHLQNIFTKIGVTSRSAATAFAYEHELV
jgi:DNA-binding NarL/FixJ family response regulator